MRRLSQEICQNLPEAKIDFALLVDCTEGVLPPVLFIGLGLLSLQRFAVIVFINPVLKVLAAEESRK